MAAAAILNFQKVTFWTLDDTCIARIYMHTKFGANRSRTGQDTPFCVFSKMAAAAILDLLFVDFGPPTMSQLPSTMGNAHVHFIGPVALTQKSKSNELQNLCRNAAADNFIMCRDGHYGMAGKALSYTSSITQQMSGVTVSECAFMLNDDFLNIQFY